jgi:hypothetical protein
VRVPAGSAAPDTHLSAAAAICALAEKGPLNYEQLSLKREILLLKEAIKQATFEHALLLDMVIVPAACTRPSQSRERIQSSWNHSNDTACSSVTTRMRPRSYSMRSVGLTDLCCSFTLQLVITQLDGDELNNILEDSS